MAEEGPRFAGTGANFNDGALNAAWSDPTNIVGDTTSTAATCAPAVNGITSHRLRASNFGFEVPDGATIDGVLVGMERAGSNNNRFRDISVRLLTGGTEAGDEHSTGSSWNAKAMDAVGAEDDLWGLALTPAIVNASDFGVSIKGERFAAQTVTASLFRVQITVTYTVAGTQFQQSLSGGISFSASPLGTSFTPGGGAPPELPALVATVIYAEV